MKAIRARNPAAVDKATSNALIFLLIFLLVHGLFDSEFKTKHHSLLTAFAILRLLALTLLLADGKAV